MRALVIGVVLFFAAHIPGRADVLAYDFNNLTRGFFVDHFGVVVGFQFDVLSPVTVTALGSYWDNTFVEDHPVGIWDTSGALITSADVTSADPLTPSANPPV